ncbi:MAG: glutamate--tRNA ligase family protein [Arhodomonas sp.]|nr:glutamate--tRNA ligase family protein [Arhodomonas sp.]
MAVDDADLGVTDIVRGADLLIATAPQMALRDALGLHRPRHLHLPLAINTAGTKLSKQTAAPAVDDAEASRNLITVLAILGLSAPEELGGAPPGELLAWAVEHWDPAALPEGIIRVA